MTVGFGISPNLLTSVLVWTERSRAYAFAITAGGELHPTLRTFLRFTRIGLRLVSIIGNIKRKTGQASDR